MQHTYAGLITWQSPRRPPTSSSQDSASPTLDIRASDSLRTATADDFSFTRTRRSFGSTIWGPGALTGKLLKRVGEGVESGAEYVVIRHKLNKIAKMQPYLLGPDRRLTRGDELEIKDQCEKLVDLCIVGMQYPRKFMTRALSLMLSGFKRPGRQTWSYHIAEAISKREIMDVFELFQECFFVLLDYSTFRIDGVVDLETLSFRCPVVAHEITTIISHLARKDRMLGSIPAPALSALSLTLSSNTAVGDPSPEISPTLSRAIIQAGFFRLVKHWSKHGLPHWDHRGIERLECALKDIADAQEYHGDVGNATEARELMRKLQGRRLILDDLEEQPEEESETEESD